MSDQFAEGDPDSILGMMGSINNRLGKLEQGQSDDASHRKRLEDSVDEINKHMPKLIITQKVTFSFVSIVLTAVLLAGLKMIFEGAGG